MTGKVTFSEAAPEGIVPLARFDGYYVDHVGRVWSAPRAHFKRWRLLGHPNPDGYLVASLIVGGRSFSRQILHRIICETFHGPPKIGHVARHLNDDPIDNRPANLAWGTPSDNSADAIKNGRLLRGAHWQAAHAGKILRGERVGNARLNEDAVRQIRKLYAMGEPLRAIARTFNVSSFAVTCVAKGQTWKHVL